MKNNKFEKPELTIICFFSEDIILTSDQGAGGDVEPGDTFGNDDF